MAHNQQFYVKSTLIIFFSKSAFSAITQRSAKFFPSCLGNSTSFKLRSLVFRAAFFSTLP
uniref:Uncharacterized protein n=1 Tax=Meloidogyne enterolobii TaxID=390850 RepID=A0A6V7WN20_MELEN|nr:unnamed protein product [Meloidogyne enterolobii]